MDQSPDQPDETLSASGERAAAAVGREHAWFKPINQKRESELQRLLDAWNQPNAEHGDRRGPFDGVKLTGADVFWLTVMTLPVVSRDAEHSIQLGKGYRRSAHLQGANLSGAHLEMAYLGEIRLDGANLNEAHLESANLHGAHLESASLDSAFLEAADLSGAHLNGASLVKAHLEGAKLGFAHLKKANLFGAHLQGADLNNAQLKSAGLIQAHLEGRVFSSEDPDLHRIRRWESKFPDTLAPASLYGAIFDTSTVLSDAVLADTEHGAVSVCDVRWGGVNLAVVPDWTPFTDEHIRLGDERTAWQWKPSPHIEDEEDRKQPQRARSLARAKHAAEQANFQMGEFQSAVRANRQLAIALRGQGMNEQADYFAYRAQVVQRRVLRLQGKRGRAFGSWLLDRTSGYGYQPMRSVATYLLVILAFAAAYFALTNINLIPALSSHSSPLAWYEALVLSISSFHGRGLFPSGLSLGDPVAFLAAGEAIIGLLIEITFIATFTQRFFAR